MRRPSAGALGVTGRDYDWLVVGAGLSGATVAERLASQHGQTVLVIDRRPYVGGNTHDRVHESGLLIHEHGPHAFHTNSRTVWRYLSRFTRWRPYEHRVLGHVDGSLVPVPFNLTALRALLPEREAAALEGRLVATYGRGATVPVLKLRESDDRGLAELGEYVYEHVFLGYNLKQWGLRPEQLDTTVSGRVPVRVSDDDRYFTDRYQAVPADGYTAMVASMLRHPRIDVALEIDLADLGPSTRWRRMAYTGPIDGFFGGRHGWLPYRSLRFEHAVVEAEQVQPVAQVNHCGTDVPYTRVTEHKLLTGQQAPRTVLTAEHPQPHVPGCTEPYYPVPREENRQLLARYQLDAERFAPEVLFLGRLAEYRYFNMDQAVLSALLKVRHLDRNTADTQTGVFATQ